MALSPGRPPDDHRDRHEKPPVTAPSHKPTGGYNIPACPLTEILDRIAASNRRPNFNTVKIQEEAANHTARIRHDPDKMMAKINEDLEQSRKDQAATSHKIQENGEIQKVIYGRLKKAREGCEYKLDGYISLKVPTSSSQNPTQDHILRENQPASNNKTYANLMCQLQKM